MDAFDELGIVLHAITNTKANLHPQDDTPHEDGDRI